MPAHAVVKGSEKEKKRTQGIADSLDLGAEMIGGERGEGMQVERRRETVVGGEPIRVVREGDGRLGLREGGRVSVGVGVRGRKRRSSVA